MPVNESSTRSTRYQKRCSQKDIEKQRTDRKDRYEKRCAMQDEAKTCVSEELSLNISSRRSSSRLSEAPQAYGFLGGLFR